MTLDTQAITKIARLARIRIEDKEKEFYAQQISGILQWVEQLNEIINMLNYLIQENNQYKIRLSIENLN